MTPVRTTLERVDAYTRAIYDRLASPTAGADGRPPYPHDFFASHTRLDHTEYRPSLVTPLLVKLAVTDAEYVLTLTRSTVTNPHHDLAREVGVDDLSELVPHLDGIARGDVPGRSSAGRARFRS